MTVEGLPCMHGKGGFVRYGGFAMHACMMKEGLPCMHDK